MRNNKPYITLIFLLLLVAGCAADKKGGGASDADNAVSPDESFALAAADSARFVDEDSSFLVRVNGIQDNRCPKDVNCITGGKALVTVTIEGSAAVVNLCTGADCFGEAENSFLLRLNNKRYNIVLEEVLPYPGDEQESRPKQAILKIKRATG
ncbi:hypothetical protein D770_16290 [Flammeovirgaceae bacterium 311]|nr:hypothetical protein D770_16290 [Flammeovirgaceae bacterium 311]